MRIVGASLSDVGRVRRFNEDALGFFPELGLYLVADGMGGHAGGREASAMAVATIRTAVEEEPTLGNPAFEPRPARLAAAIRLASDRIVGAAAADPRLSGMGTTIVGMWFGEGSTLLVHVGDSRAYRLRGDVVQRLTEDHSVVAELIRKGEMSEAEAENHPYRHHLTRALGRSEEEATGEVRPVDVQPGDLYVLCSDGVYGLVGDERLGEILLAHRDDVEQLCRQLVDAANVAGGRDNSSVIALRCVAAGEGSPE